MIIQWLFSSKEIGEKGENWDGTDFKMRVAAT